MMNLKDLLVIILTVVGTVWLSWYGIRFYEDSRRQAVCAKYGEIFNGRTKYESFVCLGEVAAGVWRPMFE